jgi:hypothetical protein
MYHQGIVVYETHLPTNKNYTLTLMANDYAMLFVDEEFLGKIAREIYQNRTIKV